MTFPSTSRKDIPRCWLLPDMLLNLRHTCASGVLSVDLRDKIHPRNPLCVFNHLTRFSSQPPKSGEIIIGRVLVKNTQSFLAFANGFCAVVIPPWHRISWKDIPRSWYANFSGLNDTARQVIYVPYTLALFIPHVANI